MGNRCFGFRANNEIIFKLNAIRDKLITDYKKTDSRVIRFCINYTHENLDKLIEHQIKKIKGV
jgi:hypothetical protein